MEAAYFEPVEATMTQLRRNASRLVRRALRGDKVRVTARGEPRVELVPVRRIDRKAALRALRAIGPVALPTRK
ncbi:MAG: type II toxin-antitoxin system prevent-host-death family antitoxin [Verrucomicrobiales bacterium]|nr:type II toxin-antitoxin system prevent-host-death family antitoxin [Verrucomicrobiales bacterium]